MTQSPSVVSPTPPLPTQAINPALGAALSSLDVQLDEELSRYRRQRSGRPVMAARGLGRAQTRKPIDLIALDTGGSRSQTPVAAIPLGTPVTPSLLASTLTAASPKGSAKTLETVPQLRQDDLYATNTPQSYSPTEEVISSPSPSPEMRNLATEASPGGELVYPAGMRTEPEDYLASSEQLLRSLAEEEPQTAKERSFRENLLTPLGVGSILLLLLCSGIAGYIVMNPSSISHLGLNRFWKSQTPTIAKNNPASVGIGNAPIEPPIPNGPNLATDEFVDLNLNNLSTLKTDPKGVVLPRQSTLPRQTTIPAPPNNYPRAANSGSPQDLATALLPPAQQPLTLPPVQSAPPRTAAPAQEPSPAKSVIASNEPIRKDMYYVVTNYDSDRSLAQARKVVSDAYVHKFPEGTVIQLGAYPQESKAKAFVEKLEKQGILASIYHP